MANNYTISERSKYHMRLTLGRYTRPNAFKPTGINTSEIIFLPLPTELRDDTTVSYNPVNLETVGDVVNGAGNGVLNAAAARNAGQVINAGLTATNRAFSKVADRYKNNFSRAAGALGGSFVGMIQSLLPPEQINAVLQQENGIAPNPNPSVSFQGPVLRDFTMTWAFYPKSKPEADKIKDMVRILKSRALPTFNALNSGAVLNYPYMCQLNFFPWDDGGSGPFGWSDNTIIKIKKCFMSGVNVNYNAFGTPAFFEGAGSYPATIQLTISFKEIEYLTAKDWDPNFAYAIESANNTSFNAATAVGTTLGLVKDTFVELTSGFVDVFTKEFLGALDADELAQQQTLDATNARIDSLPPDGSDPLVFSSELSDTASNTRTSLQWVVAGNGEGKYTVTKTTTINRTEDGKAQPTQEDEQTATFDSRAELDAYISGERGPITNKATLAPADEGAE